MAIQATARLRSVADQKGIPEGLPEVFKLLFVYLGAEVEKMMGERIEAAIPISNSGARPDSYKPED